METKTAFRISRVMTAEGHNDIYLAPVYAVSDSVDKLSFWAQKSFEKRQPKDFQITEYSEATKEELEHFKLYALREANVLATQNGILFCATIVNKANRTFREPAYIICSVQVL